MFIQVTTNSGGKITINADQIQVIEPCPAGSVIFYANGESVNIQDDFDLVSSLLEAEMT